MSFWPAGRAISALGVLIGLSLFFSCGSGSTSQGPAKLSQIKIAPANQTIAKGTTLQLSASGYYADGTTHALGASVTWQTTQSAVATITTQGDVTGVGEGVAQLSAAYQGVTGSTSVNVGPPALLNMTVGPNQSSLPVGESEQLTATGNFSDGTIQNLTQSATWSSSAPGVATITARGLATGVTAGTSSLSATMTSITSSTTLTVTAPVLASIAVTPGNASIAAGNTQQFAATGTYSDGSAQNLTSTAAWSSSAPGVAAITPGGLATGVKTGQSSLSATLGSITGSATLAVTVPVLVSIAVTPGNASIAVGTKQQFTATGTYSDASTQNLTSTAAWSSSASAIASVSSAGAALANAVGTATIGVTAGSFTGTASLTVTPAVVVVLNIVPAKLSMVLGSSSQLQAIATMSDGTTENMTGTVAWSSAQPGMASVNSGGLVTANNVGSTTILAADNGVTGSATVTVTPLLRLFFTTYYSNANYPGVPDATLRIVNDGNTDGNLYADIYVLDDSQELQECCGCLITKDGLLSESVNTELTANSLTGKSNHRGVIKIISDANANGWDNGGGSAVKPTEGLRVTATHVQSLKYEFVGATDPGGAADWAVTETEANVANLGAVETALLPEECGFIVGTQGQAGLGSGAGVCTCTPEDYDF
jgi:hypothetical protein